MRSFEPVPDPRGALRPPGRLPPTAVGVGTPEPPRRGPRSQGGVGRRPRILMICLKLLRMAPYVL